MKKITVIGIGKIGLCNALCFENSGYDVIGYDIDQKYVNSINNKTYKSFEPKVNELLNKSSNFIATTDINIAVKHSKILFIIINTPYDDNLGYSHNNLNNFISQINSLELENYEIIISSSIRPGYFKNELPKITNKLVKCNFSYSPQFVRQGDIINTFIKPHLIIIGVNNNNSKNILKNIYENILVNKPYLDFMSIESAEICKFANASLVTMKISFTNFISAIADSTPNADKNEIMNSLGHDKRIGNGSLLPGWGYGGPCFPRDNKILINYAESLNIPSNILKETHNYNEFYAYFKANMFLNNNDNDNKIIIDEVSYRPNCPIPMIENSHKLKVAKLLVKNGKKVIIKDNKFVIEKVKEEFSDLFDYEII